jgi:hypothetical protein
VGTVRQSDSGADPFATLGEAPISPTGTAPQAGRRAPSETGGISLPVVPLSPTPRSMRTSSSGGRPAPINPSAQVKSPTAPPSPPVVSVPEPEPTAVNAPPSPVSRAVFKPGFGSMNGRPTGPSILDETLAVEKHIKPGQGGFTSIPSELKETLNSVEETDLIPCQTCGRKFNPKSYEKHVSACAKLATQPKREIYSSMGKR